MVDRLTSEQRSELMRRVRGKDTAPEMIVRRLAHRAGFRFRLHRKDLPGKPDLCFPARRKAIFVHGCFWHGHDCRRGARVPKTNREYWTRKLARNKARDLAQQEALAAAGWAVMVVWECEIRDLAALAGRLGAFLS